MENTVKADIDVDALTQSEYITANVAGKVSEYYMSKPSILYNHYGEFVSSVHGTNDNKLAMKKVITLTLIER